jgi:sulfite exporter TauE/SafE
MIAAIAGLTAGIMHVGSGPDHLAAIAPLSLRKTPRSWLVGARWGLGHSAGVGVIGILLLWFRDLLPLQWLSVWGERLVGVMLIGIGLWALRKALRIHSHEHDHHGDRHVHLHAHAQAARHEPAAHSHHTHAAFGIGLLHGLAGSSHFYGILPALAFPSRNQAIVYLISFAAGTVLSMGVFSSILQWLALRHAVAGVRAYRFLMISCALAALGVGCFWLLA